MQQRKIKLLPYEAFSSEILLRMEEFIGDKSTYHELAHDYTQWCIADDIRSSMCLCYNVGLTKEELIEQIWQVGVRAGDTWYEGIKRSSLPKNKKIKKESFSQKAPQLIQKKYLNEDFGFMTREEIIDFFEEFEHLDWFEATWEMDILGSGSDLTDLANYGFMGYLNCGQSRWIPWTLRKLCKPETHSASEKWIQIDPVTYITKLIENCKRFIDQHPGTRSGIGDGNVLFRKALRHAETRLQLDTKKYVNADDIVFITNLNLRTLANIGILQPKQVNEEYKILSKDALSFLVDGIKPNGQKLRNTRSRSFVDENLSKDFYTSLWKEQVYYGVTADCGYEWEVVELVSTNNFISDSPKTKLVTSGKYIRTSKEFDKRIAPHNKERIEWIGEGKTFSEINKAGSKYRKNVKRKSYSGNESSIIQDLEYDLKKGLIKRFK